MEEELTSFPLGCAGLSDLLPKNKVGKEGENSNFAVEKHGKYYCNQVREVNITSDIMWILHTPVM